jgi:hypothetical protein
MHRSAVSANCDAAYLYWQITDESYCTR